jgi:hypothetical protein
LRTNGRRGDRRRRHKLIIVASLNLQRKQFLPKKVKISSLKIKILKKKILEKFIEKKFSAKISLFFFPVSENEKQTKV